MNLFPSSFKSINEVDEDNYTSNKCDNKELSNNNDQDLLDQTESSINKNVEVEYGTN